MQTIKINKKTGQEYQVSIRCAWPDIVTKGNVGKLRGSRSRLLGNREIDCRVVVKPKKSVQNALDKARKSIAENKLKRARFSLVAANPVLKTGPVKADGSIQPRVAGKFLPKVKLA